MTRREALIAAAALLAGACAGQPATHGGGHPAGSTIDTTWGDPEGTGVLRPIPGEPLTPRTELGRPAPATRQIATLAHLTDAHVLDASSPARVPFLDRLGDPFESTFRPQETLTAQVLAGALAAIGALKPDAVIQGGDLIDNAQANELELALSILRGGPIPARRRYVGPQLESNPDPFYYRPDLDAPRHSGLLTQATRAFTSPGTKATYPVLGDHDILVQGEIPPTEATQRLATGDQAVWELPPNLTLPSRPTATLSPDGPPDPSEVDAFLAEALAGPKLTVLADPTRRELTPGEVVSTLGHAKPTLDYAVDLGPRLRLIILDLPRRAGGSGGLVRPEQPPWLAAQLRKAAGRWMIVASHQPLAGSAGGDQLLALLDRNPRVIATLAGHTHRNAIEPRRTPAGGYWMINTASLIDYPQQARAVRITETTRGVAIHTWMLDHRSPDGLGRISRQLAYLDAQGGRPRGFAGARIDRNVTLYADRT
jgi:3',5'-cyclic AMP phosphodiesterase CpdA